MRIALFITCFNDLLFPEVGRSMVRVLERLGHTVELPAGQTCCGQLHFNTGYRDDCIPLVRRFTETFRSFDVVVTPSPSCAAMVRHQHSVVAAETNDRRLRHDVELLGPRVLEFTELLIDLLGVEDVGACFGRRVVFHPTCHSTRLLAIGDRPQRLLRAVEGLTLVDLPDATACCGFGGTFSVKNPDTSLTMGADKVAAVIASGAEVLTAADTSCLLHLGGMLTRTSPSFRTMHLAEILAMTDGAG